MNTIKPTVGRIVLVRSNDPLVANHKGQELPGIVTAVHGGSCISLTVFRNQDDPAYRLTSVMYAEDHVASGWSHSWRWMDYQKAQAKKGVQ